MEAVSGAAASLPEERAWKRRLREGPLSRAEADDFAGFALDRVSRTFALNIRVLPEPLRRQVLHAYLYCRMADTVEDDPLLPPAEKLRLLAAFSSLFDPDRPAPEALAAAAEFPSLLPPAWRDPEDWEKLLLAHAPLLLRAFAEFPRPARAAIAECVREMCAGMADFAARRESGAAPVATLVDLDRYCWYVAGTVGVMLCELFLGSGRIPAGRGEALRARCVSFGLGLQLTNILKDLHDDRERGVSWLPGDLLAAEGLPAGEFPDPDRHPAARRVVRSLFSKALLHLREGLEYSCRIPRRQRRLRLFCLWPLFLAAETLALLAEGGSRRKIRRARVRAVLLRTGLLWWSDAWLRAWFASLERRLLRALHEPARPDTFAP